jgi:hypothetical protein
MVVIPTQWPSFLYSFGWKENLGSSGKKQKEK